MSPSAKKWRQRVGEIPAALHLKSYDGVKQELGRRWAHDLRQTIAKAGEDEWRELLGQLEANRRRKDSTYTALKISMAKPGEFGRT